MLKWGAQTSWTTVHLPPGCNTTSINSVLHISLHMSQSTEFTLSVTPKSPKIHPTNFMFIALTQISYHYQLLSNKTVERKAVSEFCSCSCVTINVNNYSSHFHVTILLRLLINVQDSWSNIFVALWMSLFALRKALSTRARSNPISINVCTCSSEGCTLFSRTDIKMLSFKYLTSIRMEKLKRGGKDDYLLGCNPCSKVDTYPHFGKKKKKHLLPLLSWRWKRQVSQKCWLISYKFTGCHTQKKTIKIFTDVKTPNPVHNLVISDNKALNITHSPPPNMSNRNTSNEKY